MLEVVKPRISTEYFSIGSGLRPAPTYDNGMPIPARKRSCLINVGLECPYVSIDTECDPDNKHHLFFNKDLYYAAGEEYVTLRENPLMIIEMARCRHNSSFERAAHSLSDFVPLPATDVARGANVESFAIVTMVNILNKMKQQIAPYKSTHGPTRHRAGESNAVWEKARRLNRLASDFDQCARRVDSIQLVPRTIIGRKLEELHAERRRLRLVAFEDSTHVLPYPVAAELAA